MHAPFGWTRSASIRNLQLVDELIGPSVLELTHSVYLTWEEDSSCLSEARQLVRAFARNPSEGEPTPAWLGVHLGSCSGNKLEMNDVPHAQRGWCIAERMWMAVNNLMRVLSPKVMLSACTQRWFKISLWKLDL